MKKNALVYSKEGFKLVQEIVVGDELFNGNNFIKVKSIKKNTKRIFKLSLDYCIDIFLSEDCIVPVVNNKEKKSVKVVDVVKSDNMLFYANKYPDLDFIEVSNNDNSLDISSIPLFLLNKYNYKNKNERTLFLKDVVLEDVDNWINQYALIKILSIEEVDDAKEDFYFLEFENTNSSLILDNVLIEYSFI